MAKLKLTHIGSFSQDLSHLIRILNELRAVVYALLGRYTPGFKEVDGLGKRLDYA